MVHRPETTPMVPFYFSVGKIHYFLWRKSPGITLNFQVASDGMQVKVTTNPPTNEELGKIIKDCPVMNIPKTILEFRIPFEKVLNNEKLERVGLTSIDFDGISIEERSSESGVREI